MHKCRIPGHLHEYKYNGKCLCGHTIECALGIGEYASEPKPVIIEDEEDFVPRRIRPIPNSCSHAGRMISTARFCGVTWKYCTNCLEEI